MRFSKTVFALIIVCLFYSSPQYCFGEVAEQPVTMYVPTDEYPTIADALLDAGSSDVIGVADGDHYVSLQINVIVNGVTIRSENGAENCRILFAPDALGQDHVFYVTADNVLIKGFTIVSDNYNLVEIIRVEGISCNIQDNIFLTGGVADVCKAVNAEGFAFKYNHVNSSAIHAAGLDLMYCDSSNVEGNTFVDNGDVQIDVLGSSGVHIIDNFLFNNSEKAIFVHNGTDVTIQGNTIEGNDAGIYLSLVSDSLIEDNIIHDNDAWGILLHDGSNRNTVLDNLITGHRYYVPTEHAGYWTGYGIKISKSSYLCVNNTITRNRVEENYYGINDDLFGDNYIYLNNFVDNDNNIYGYFSVYNTPTQFTYRFNGSIHQGYLGNYWSDYSGIGTTGTGVGDISYDGSNDWDLYPLTEIESHYTFVQTHQIVLKSKMTTGRRLFGVPLKLDDSWVRTVHRREVYEGRHTLLAPRGRMVLGAPVRFSHFETSLGEFISGRRWIRFNANNDKVIFAIYEPITP